VFTLCPGAPVIAVVRHGLEVAASIEREARAGRWYGRDGRKWSLLVEHASTHGYRHLVGRCTTPFLRGLLEWRMSVEAADAYLAAHPGLPTLRLRYEDVVRDPLEAARTMQAFLGLTPSAEVDRFAADVRRRHPPAGAAAVGPEVEAIAGDLLRRLGYWGGGACTGAR